MLRALGTERFTNYFFFEKRMKSPFIPTTVRELYHHDHILGAYALEGVMYGGIETLIDGKSREIALAEVEWYMNKGETIQDSLIRFDKNNLQNYTGKAYFGFLREDDLYLPVFALGFDARLLSSFQTSWQANKIVFVRGFYQGSRGNSACNPIFLEEFLFKNWKFRRSK